LTIKIGNRLGAAKSGKTRKKQVYIYFTYEKSTYKMVVGSIPSKTQELKFLGHGFELHRPSIKGTKLLLKVVKAIIIIMSHACV